MYKQFRYKRQVILQHTYLPAQATDCILSRQNNVKDFVHYSGLLSVSRQSVPIVVNAIQKVMQPF